MNPVFPMASAVGFFIGQSKEQNIVVGETARAQNLQLGGYPRDTNPELSKRDIEQTTRFSFFFGAA